MDHATPRVDRHHVVAVSPVHEVTPALAMNGRRRSSSTGFVVGLHDRVADLMRRGTASASSNGTPWSAIHDRAALRNPCTVTSPAPSRRIASPCSCSTASASADRGTHAGSGRASRTGRLEDGEGRSRQRHAVRLAHLHALFRNRQRRGVEVDLIEDHAERSDGLSAGQDRGLRAPAPQLPGVSLSRVMNAGT